MPIDTGESAFKALFNRQNTNDPPAKQFYEENGRAALKLKSSEVWADAIDGTDPSVDVTNGVAELRTLFVLTEDVTVPGQATWTAEDGGNRLTDWMDVDDGDPTVNPFVSPYRIRIFDNTDAEIFLTDPSQPFWNGKQGILRFGGPVTRPTPFKVTGHRYIGQRVDAIASPIDVETTSENFNIPMDAAGGIAVPPGTKFYNQASVNDALGAATGFTNVQDVWEAIAINIGHAITVTQVGGVYRPNAAGSGTAFRALTLYGKIFTNSGSVDFNGDTTRTEILAPVGLATVTPWNGTTQVASIQAIGTPFTGLDLRGKFAEFSNGTFSVISSNTADTLTFMDPMLPNPTAGVDTVRIVRPSTIWRNSQDDSTSQDSFFLDIANSAASGNGFVRFRDIQFDTFGEIGMQQAGRDISVELYQCMCDYEYVQTNFGVTPDGRFAQTFGNNQVFFSTFDCSVYDAAKGADEPFTAFGGTNMTLQRTICAGMREAITSVDSIIQMFNVVCDDVGTASSSSLRAEGSGSLIYASPSFAFGTFGGHRCEVRNAPGIGFALENGESIPTFNPVLWFGNVTGNCVDIRGRSTVDILLNSGLPSGGGLGFMDIGGNGAFGMVVDAIFTQVVLPAQTDVTGTSGDADLFDGVGGTSNPQTWAAISAGSPNNNPDRFNIVEKL